jgi:hypothetical protein
MKNAEKPASSAAPIARPRNWWWIRLIGYMKRKMDERAAKKQNETPVDRAARVTAKATAWIAVFTLVSIVVSSVTLLILKGQLDHSDAQFSVSHRPWVNMAVPIKIDGPLVFSESGAQIPMTYILKNGGTAPALGVNVFTVGLAVGTLPHTPEDARRVIDCEEPASIPFSIAEFSNKIGTLILPGDSSTTQHFLLKTQPVNFTKTAVATDIWAPVCIRYKDEAGNHHATGFLLVFISRAEQSQIVPIGSVEGELRVNGWGYVTY